MIDSHMYNTTYFNRGRDIISHPTHNYDLDCNLSDDLFINSILQ